MLGTMRADGLKIYGPGWSASSDRANRSAAPGRPIGDLRLHASGVLLPRVWRRGRRSANDGGTRRLRGWPLQIDRRGAKPNETGSADLLEPLARSGEQRELAGDERRRRNSSDFVEMVAPVDGVDEVLD